MECCGKLAEFSVSSACIKVILFFTRYLLAFPSKDSKQHSIFSTQSGETQTQALKKPQKKLTQEDFEHTVIQTVVADYVEWNLSV